LIAAVMFGHLAIVTGCAHSGTTSNRVSGPSSNADGSTSVGRQRTTDEDGTTTTVRERQTTSLDGSIRRDRETLVTVDGPGDESTDKRTSETTNIP